MYLLSRNSCAKAFGNWSRRSDLRPKKKTRRGGRGSVRAPSPSLTLLGLRKRNVKKKVPRAFRPLSPRSNGLGTKLMGFKLVTFAIPVWRSNQLNFEATVIENRSFLVDPSMSLSAVFTWDQIDIYPGTKINSVNLVTWF